MTWTRTPCDTGSCVEVKAVYAPDMVLIRSTEVPEHELLVTPSEWRAFVDAVKAGYFDGVA